MAKLMNIGRVDRCAACGADLPAGTSAYWLRASRVVVCTTCYASSGTSAAAAPTSATDATEARDVAGGSAQREYDMRSARELARKQQRVADDADWRRTLKERRPVLGRLVTAVTPKPQGGPESPSTTAWKTGAEGERRVAEVLADVAGIEVLHDRLVPGRRAANIDHVVVGPSGVFVVDAKKYAGRIEVRDVGGIFRTDLRLHVNGRDRTKLVDAVLGQVIRIALGNDVAAVPVRGVLCFIGCDWGLRRRTKHLRGVTALWPAALPRHVTAEGPLAGQVSVIAERLRRRLRAAPGS